MALINCPECNKKISDQSPQCIHCGFPLEKKNSGRRLVDKKKIDGYYTETHKIADSHKSRSLWQVIYKFEKSGNLYVRFLLIKDEYADLVQVEIIAIGSWSNEESVLKMNLDKIIFEEVQTSGLFGLFTGNSKKRDYLKLAKDRFFDDIFYGPSKFSFSFNGDDLSLMPLDKKTKPRFKNGFQLTREDSAQSIVSF